MKPFKRHALVALLLFFGGCIGIAAAQVVAQPMIFADLKSGGSAINFFRKVPSVLYLNFNRGVKISGRTMTTDIQAAPFDPDLGVTEGPAGVQVGPNTNVAKPTCSATYRGMFYLVATSGTGDAGVKDLSYQCCKAADGTYSWVAVACQ
jgi:hypothetical protein